jgi:hypothetical protein
MGDKIEEEIYLYYFEKYKMREIHIEHSSSLYITSERYYFLQSYEISGLFSYCLFGIT